MSATTAVRAESFERTPASRRGVSAEVAAVLTIAYRDFLKFLRDRPRIISSFIFPFIFIGALGGSMQGSLGASLQYNFLTYTFTGVLAQTLFQSTAFGLISLIEDRENDFTQEIFVSPISRYSIVFGKILGESLVAVPQGLAILLFALVIGVPLSPGRLAALVPASILACLLGGAFGLVILSNLGSRRAADQIFPFVMLPQYFLAGVFNPIQNIPPYLDAVSRISPLRYAVDLTRNAFYAGSEEHPHVVVDSLLTDAAVTAAMFALFLVLGTITFVRQERNR